MRILELNIIQFGKFSDRTLTLEEGFNVVEGKNESGKSTLQAFIKFIFYGLPRRNPNVLIGERERALSWLGQIAAGSITLESEGKKYRIERSGRTGARGAYSEKHRTIDLSSGAEVYENEIPGEVFLGIDVSAYDSMCNVRQLECTSVDGDAVKGAIENLLSSGDENTSVDAAFKMLDRERVRLLHKNGRGGLVFEAEKAYDTLESEYEKALRLEGENIKHREELERTERQLEAAKKSYEISQTRCDLFEDVKRLEKFERLKGLKEKNEKLTEQIAELDREAGAENRRPTYDGIAEMKTVSDTFKRNEGLLEYAKKEKSAAQERIGRDTDSGSDELDALIFEFGSSRNVVNNLTVKNKKKTRAKIFCAIAFALAASAFGGAIALILLKSLIAGAATLAFVGIVSAVLGFVFFSQVKSAARAAKAIVDRIGNGFSARDVDKILAFLEDFERMNEERKTNASAYESANARLAVAEENYNSSRDEARKILDGFGIACNAGEEGNTLASLAESLREYLSNRSELETERNENGVLINSLSSELERYSEQAIAKKITPEIEAAVRNSSFETLQKARNAELNKINVLNRHKAELERQLGGLESGKRSPNELYPELERQKKRMDELKLRHDAILLAREKIEEASQKLKSEIVPRIKSFAEKNMSIMTDGKYSELFLDDSMALTVLADGETRPIDALSKGSCDVAYFSVRLALLEVMCADKKPPLFMDESLSQLDDDRASRAISAAAEYCKDGAQCVLFTCQTRDARLARNVTKTNLISLS